MHVHEALAQRLHDLGVTTVFGVIGEGNLYVVDAFATLPGAKYVGAGHEAGAVLMAAGHAQIAGGVGVATVTHGPGLTNTLTALVEAQRNHTPVVLLAGAVAADDPGNAQALDQTAVLEATGIATLRPTDAANATTILSNAIARAHHDSGPVVFQLPADLMWATSPPADPPATDRQPASPAVPSAKELDTALGVLAGAARPLILAGHGATTPEARDALVRLAEQRGAHLMTTLRAKDLFAGHPADAGVCGSFATPYGAAVIGRATCVIAFGASLNDYTTMNGELLADKAVVQVDRSPAAIGRWRQATTGVVGDSAMVATAMSQLLSEADIDPSGFVPADATGQPRERWAPRAPSHLLDPYDAAAALEQAVPAERVLAPDAGRFLNLVFRAISNPPLHSYVHGIGFGAIGIGLAQALGAWFAAPGRPVLHVTGDGGFMLGGLTELPTAVRHRADLIVVVLNDGSYGAEHIQMRRRDRAVDVTMMAWPDLAATARGLGVTTLTVTTAADLSVIKEFVTRREGPVLIDVHLDPDQLNALVP